MSNTRVETWIFFRYSCKNRTLGITKFVNVYGKMEKQWFD